MFQLRVNVVLRNGGDKQIYGYERRMMIWDLDDRVWIVGLGNISLDKVEGGSFFLFFVECMVMEIY